MSGETRFENHQEAESRETISKGKVKLYDLLSNLKKRKDRNNNIILSIAVVSAVTVFGIILSI